MKFHANKIFILFCFVTFLFFSSTLESQGQQEELLTLKVMNYSLEEREFYEDVSHQFSKEYPGIKLEFVTIVNTEYKKHLPLLFEQNNAPDIFTYHSNGDWVLSMSELLSKGWISPIGQAKDLKDSWISRWSGGSFVEEINIHDDMVYGFPYTEGKVRGAGYLFCNTGVLKKAGLHDVDIPEDWDDFVQVCETVKKNTGLFPLVIPTKAYTDIKNTWLALAGSSKTDLFFDYQKGRFCIDDNELVEAFLFIKTLYERKLVLPGSYDLTNAREAFGKGNSAFIFDASYLPNVLRKKMGMDITDIAISKPPYPDNKPKGTLACRNTENKIWISSQSKHLKEARVFIEWMTRPNGFYAREYLKRGLGVLAYSNCENSEGEIPAELTRIIEVSQELKKNYPEPLQRCSDLSKSNAYQLAEAYHPNWEWEVIQRALFNNEDFSSLASEITKKKNEILKENLQQEKEQGLNVSIQCYQFPDWDCHQQIIKKN